MTARIDAFRAMLVKQPANPLVRFGLAGELLKEGQHEEAIGHLEAYLASYDDEGNGYGRLAQAYEAVGRLDDARAALRKGIDASHRFGHAGMANDLSARLEELEEQ